MKLIGTDHDETPHYINIYIFFERQHVLKEPKQGTRYKEKATHHLNKTIKGDRSQKKQITTKTTKTKQAFMNLIARTKELYDTSMNQHHYASNT